MASAPRPAARLGVKAVLAGTLFHRMSATIAGLFITLRTVGA